MWSSTGTATGNFLPTLIQSPFRMQTRGRVVAELGDAYSRIREKDNQAVNRLHAALELAFFCADRTAGPCPVPGYFDNPENPFHVETPPVDNNSEPFPYRSAERFGLALEAIVTFMLQSGFRWEVRTEFAHFMHAYDFHLRGFPQRLFDPVEPTKRIDSPHVWTIKCYFALAVEAYLEDGVKDRTTATRFIADCLTPRRGKSAVEAALSGTRKRS